jgi:predicted RNA-binding Zn-ribbon protein involved in translation (DUF1610 family)
MLFNLNKQIAKPLQCPDCGLDMDFLASQPMKRVFLSSLLERRFFLCPNCGLLSHGIVSISQASCGSQSGFDFAFWSLRSPAKRG